tara:strand:+ start:5477 stop:9934 length:4458 start_codon:yes stop_codon:yes gene_type:complete
MRQSANAAAQRIPFRVKTSAWVALVAGLCCSFAAYWLVIEANKSQIRRELALESSALAEAISMRFERYQYGLRGARAAILGAGIDDISRQQFHSYSLTRDLEHEFPGARGFGFIRRVPVADEAKFLNRARADSWESFSIRQLTAHDSERFVIQYIEPVQWNMQAVGLDIASETNRRTAAWSAIKAGEARLTGPITLVQATGKPLQSFLILLPVYRGWATPTTTQERESEAIGWSYAPLITDEVLEGLTDSTAAEFRITDVTDSDEGAEAPFYASPTDEGLTPTEYHTGVTWDVFGRTWHMDYQANNLFIERLQQPSPNLVLLGGGSFSLLLAALMSIWGVSRQRRRQVADTQAWMAAIVENSADAIIGNTTGGEIISWNPGAQRLFGYTESEALGKNTADLIVPHNRLHEDTNILDRISKGERVDSFDTQRLSKDGRLLDVAVTASPIRNDQGGIVGASKTVRDISEHKALEARLREVNSGLEAQVVERTRDLVSSLETTRSILATAMMPIITIDDKGVIKTCNPASEKAFGYTSEEMIGNNVSMLMPEPFASHHAQYLKAFHSSQSDRMIGINQEVVAMRRDGSVFPVQISLGRMSLDDQNMVVGIISDLSDQHRQRDEITQAHDQLSLAAEAAEMGIWTWDLQSDSLEWNERMFTIYAQPKELMDQDITYELWRSRVHPDDVLDAEAQLKSAIDGTGEYHPTFRVIHPNGNVRYVQAAARVSRTPSGQAVRVTGINIDITRERQMQAELLDAKERADAASAAKSSFLANMSHEIRTPMNAVMGMLKLASQTHLTSRQRDYLEKAQGAAKALLGLLNDILDYSKIEAGKLELEQHPFELESLMRDLAVVLSGNLGDKQVEVIFDIDTNLPSVLVGDRLRLQQVLINLAGNAIKFTEQGQVVISVRCVALDQEKVKLRVGVQDSGIGIDSKQLGNIFDSFTQAEASTTRRFGGTGLGLYICSHLVELMGSELNVHSELGEGSEFWFELNLAAGDATKLKDAMPAETSKMRVLVVDDNEISGHVLTQTLSAIGWHAEFVNGGLSAVGKIIAAAKDGAPFQVVLMDWRMPELDGIDAAKLLQSMEGEHEAPVIIMITAYGREVLATLQEQRQSPFSRFLTKPVTPQQLASAIAQATIEKSGKAISPLLPPSYKRLTGLKLLVVEDNALNQQVAFELLTNEGAVVELASNGEEGVHAVLRSPGAFDLILMDMQMPVVDGLEATRRIRATNGFEALPIIAMTANAAEADKRACIEAGMNDHVAKPFDLDALVYAINQQLGISPTPTELGTAPREPGALLESKEQILRRFSGNESLVRRLQVSFAEQMRSLISSLIEQKDDIETTAALLHTIKGAAATMGCVALSEFAARHEAALQDPSDTTDHVDFDSMQSLADRSVQALVQTFGPEENASDSRSDEVGDDDAKAQVLALLESLESRSMKAVSQLDDLHAYLQRVDAERAAKLTTLVQELDFDAAITVLRELRESIHPQ